MLGGIAALTQAVLLDAGFELVHVPGLAVNRARQGTTGGEARSDPRDARVIADQLSTRSDLRTISTESELDIELRLLVSRRRDLSEDQTRRLARMHDLLVGIFPKLEHALDMTSKTALVLLSGFVTPATLMRPSSAACPVWGPFSPLSSSSRQAASRASNPPMPWPLPLDWLPS